MNGKTHSRRKFIKATGAMLTAGAASSMFIACDNSSSNGPTDSSGTVLDLNQSELQPLQTTGNGVITTVDNQKMALYRVSESEIIAVSAICTHRGCTVEAPSNDEIICKCHGSRFNAETGAVIQGPADEALTRYSTTLDQKDLTITF